MPVKVIIILVLVAIVAMSASFLLGPVISSTAARIATPAEDLGDVAVTAAGQYLAMQYTQAAYTPTPGDPGPSAADVAATVAAIPINAEATRHEQERRDDLAQATAEAREFARQSTQIAQATATGEYWRGVYYEATSAAAYAQTATAYPPTVTAQAWTQTAIPLMATAEANRINAESTVVSGNAMRVDMAVRQERWASPLRQVTMIVVILGALAVAFLVAWYSKKVRRLTPDGTVQLVEGQDGVPHVVNAALMPSAVMTLAKAQPATAGGMVDRSFQADVTRRAQEVKAIEAAARGQRPDNALESVSALMGPQPARYTLNELPAGEVLDGDVVDRLDADWKEEG